MFDDIVFVIWKVFRDLLVCSMYTELQSLQLTFPVYRIHCVVCKFNFLYIFLRRPGNPGVRGADYRETRRPSASGPPVRHGASEEGRSPG